jgi:hypothetical protein
VGSFCKFFRTRCKALHRQTRHSFSPSCFPSSLRVRWLFLHRTPSTLTPPVAGRAHVARNWDRFS